MSAEQIRADMNHGFVVALASFVESQKSGVSAFISEQVKGWDLAQLTRLIDNCVVLVEDDAPADDPELLGLYDGEGILHHVGFTSAIAASERGAPRDAERTTCRRILTARSLGVSHNLIPQRIGSKDDLWRAAVAQGFGRLAAEWNALESRMLTFRERLQPVQLDAYYQLVEHPVAAHGLVGRLVPPVA